jgi:Ca2+-binding EF-hand superfamily protein
MKNFAILSLLTLLGFAGSTLIDPPAAIAADKKADKKKNKKANKAATKVEALFKKLDTNGDGKLSKDEFAKIAAEKKKKAAAKTSFVVKKADKKKNKKGNKLERLFTRLDADKDGFLSLDEFKKLAAVRAELKKDKKK